MVAVSADAHVLIKFINYLGTKLKKELEKFRTNFKNFNLFLYMIVKFIYKLIKQY